jgi:hypothetical protein
MERAIARSTKPAAKAPSMPLQRKSAGQAAPTQVPPIVHEVLNSPGQPLDAATRAYMEPRFGHDFSKVRVHADGKAGEAAESIGARAFNSGRDVVFGEDQYVPQNETGRRLLAHELAHTVQRGTGSTAVPGLGRDNSNAEREADDFATSVLDGSEETFIAHQSLQPGQIARQQEPAVAVAASDTSASKTTATPAAETSAVQTGGSKKELSGVSWVSKFSGSSSTSDLIASFKTSVDNFIAAMEAGGATVTISATLRPKERAHLMHYSWEIAKADLDPEKVPDCAGVDIDWVHRDADAKVDLPASKKAAQEMVTGYGIVKEPSLTSRHTEGRAIDMTISWAKDLKIKDAKDSETIIATTPRSGENSELQKAGKSFGVIKATFSGDPPHWSDDGS